MCQVWGGGYKKVVIFEPDDLNIKKVKRNIKENKGILIVHKGVWNKTMKLPFKSAGNEASKVVDQANWMEAQSDVKTISVVAMDDMQECQDATFIKMDLEGAEMQALQGAENIIKRNKPKLAVCIYHSDQDMLEIIRYIHKIVPEYSLYVRQYSNGIGETVLYAVYKR